MPACDCLREDHRAIEEYLDRLLRALNRVRVEQLPQLKGVFEEIRRLSAVHFQREELVLYPSLRPFYPDLVARMDDQHETIREVEECLAETLSNIPAVPESRWLNELRSVGIEFHDHIQHHIVDEEEQLFRVAAACLLPPDQARVAAEMKAIQIENAGPPRPAPSVGRRR